MPRAKKATTTTKAKEYKPAWTVAKVESLEEVNLKFRSSIKVRISEPLKPGYSYFIQTRAENFLTRRISIESGYVDKRDFVLLVENLDDYHRPFTITKGMILADCIVIPKS